MNRCLPRVRNAVITLAASLASMAACGHSASDAYLTLTKEPPSQASGAHQTVVRGQWDIALRDLDFVLKLDDNGDGNIVWGELRKHQPAIARYAYAYLRFSADGRECRMVPTSQMVDDHADGAYASLMFEITCVGAPTRLTVDYRLFFAVDPSHRAILVFRNGENMSTSVLSPDRPRINLEL